MKIRCSSVKGGCFVAFGAGLLIALICPVHFVLILEALILVLAGLSLLR